MLFMFFCNDKPGHEQLRLDTRQAHLDYLGGFRDRALAVGPTLTEDGQHMNGSLLILDLADRKEAEEFARNDPYAQAGLFESVTIRAWKKVIPAD